MSNQSVGGLSIDVLVEVTQAIQQIQGLTAAFGDAAKKINKFLEDAFGRATLEKPLQDFKILSETLSRLDAQIGSLAAGGKGRDLFPQFKQALADLTALREEVAKGLGPPSGLSQADIQANKQQEALARNLFMLQTQESHDLAVQKEADFNRTTQAASAAADQQTKIAKAAFAAQQQLGAELSASLNRTNPQAVIAQQKAFDQLVRGAQGATVATDGLSKSSGLLGGVLARLQGVIGPASQSLSGLGVNLSSVSQAASALDSGNILALAAAVALVGTKLSLLGDQMQVVQGRIEAVFGKASEDIQKFADTTGIALGFTQQEVISAAATFGDSFAQFDIGKKQAEQMSIALVQAASAIRFTATGAVPLQKALVDIGSALEGNVRSLRQYGIRTDELALKDALFKEQGLKVVGALTEQQKALAAVDLVLETAKNRSGEFAAQQGSLSQQFTILKSSITTISTALGAVLLPIFKDIVGPISDVLFLASKLAVALESLGRGSKIAEGGLKVLLRISEDLATGGLAEVARLTGAIADKFGKGKQDAQAFADGLSAAGGASKSSAEQLQSLADAHDHLAQVIGDTEISVNQAEVRLSRAIADAATRNADAQRGLAEAYRDRNKAIGEANANLADAEKEAAKNNAEAAKNLVTVQKEAAKAIKDAEISLKEVRAGAAKDITEAEKNLAEVRKDSAQAILDANDRYAKSIDEINNRVENAQKKVLDVQKSISDELDRLTKKNQDAVRAVIDAEASLNDVRKSAAERVAEADRKLAVLDGRRFAQLSKLNNVALRAVAGQEALAKARKELADAIEEGQKRIAEAEKKEAEARQKVIDSGVEINKAQEEGNKKLLEAQAELVRIQEQALKDIERADREHTEAIIKANDAVIEARQKLADTIIKANEKIAEAQKKLKDTIKESDQKVIDASNHLKDVLIESAKKVQDAQDKLKDAIITANDKIADAQRRVTAAQVDSARAITDAQVQLTIANRAAESAIHAAESAYIKLQASVAPTKKGIQDIETEALRLKAIFDATKLDPLNPRPLPIVPISFFAAGGDVRRGRTIIVGERGPELFTPNSDGHITSNSDLKNQSGATYTVNVYTNREDPDVVAARVASRLGAKSTR